MFADDEQPQGALETAIWCNACFLPSGVRWPLLTGHPSHQRSIGSIIMCEDCGQRLSEDGFPIADET